MVTLMSTKMTKSGQTTVPKEIRASLGINDNARVYWAFDGKRAWITADPLDPLSITDEHDFYNRLAEAEESVTTGRVRDASLISNELRQKYSLA